MSQPQDSSPRGATTPPFQDAPLESDLPGFVTPPAAPQSRSDSPPPAASPPGETPPAPATGKGSGRASRKPEKPDALDGPQPAKKTRSPVSTDPAAFAGIFRSLLQLVTFILHLRLAPKHTPNDVWLADEQDLQTISAPLSRIAARHSPIDGPGGDVGDLVEAMVAVGGYGIKNTIKAAELEQPPGWAQQDEQHQAADPTPAPQTAPAPAPAPANPFG